MLSVVSRRLFAAPRAVMCSRASLARRPSTSAASSAFLNAATGGSTGGSGSMSNSATAKPSLAPQDQIHQRIAGRKRFYKKVSVEPIGDAYHLLLDGKKLRTPARNDLHLPNRDLAVAIALEWDAQTDEKRGIQPASMPLMVLASTAVDTVAPDRDTVVRNVLKYLPTDTALFLAPAEQRILLKKQRQHFDPLTRWARQEFGLELRPSESLLGRQALPQEVLARAEAVVRSMLACMQSATMECKSFLMALALLSRRLTVATASAAARVEEDFQTEIWGVVEGGHDMDILNNSVALAAVDTFLVACTGSEAAFRERLAAWRAAAASTSTSASAGAN